MKKTTLIFFCLFFTSSIAQNLAQNLLNDFCSYMEDYNKIHLENQDKVDYSDCFDTILEKRKDELEQYFLKTHENFEEAPYYDKYNIGYRFMNDIIYDNLNFLVFECEPFYLLFENGFRNDIDKLYSNANEQQIENLTEKIEKYTFKTSFYLERGIKYFELKKYPEAKFDLKKVLESNPQNLQALLYLAWVEDISENFDIAIEIYNEIILISDYEKLKIFLEVAKRKKIESKH